MAGFKELIAYKKAKQLADEVFEITKHFPSKALYII
jgi:hypothetical protein